MKALIFDFGNVLYDYDGDNFNNTLKTSFGLTDNELLALSKGVFQDYMMGTCTSDEVVAAVKKYNSLFELNDFEDLFKNNFHKNDDMVNLLHKLKANYKLGLLTDTGPIPYKLFMVKELLPLFDAITLSFNIGVKKPNKIMYEDIVKKMKELPSEMLFVDDKEKNISAAKELGMQGYLFDNYDGFAKYLVDQGISV